MMERLRRLSRRQAILLAAFIVAATVTGLFGARFVASTIYWSQHRDEPVQPWMTIGYVANSHRVPPWILYEALDLPIGHRDRRPLSEIAATQGISSAEAVARVVEAIVKASPPNPPPPSSPPDDPAAVAPPAAGEGGRPS